MSFNTQTGPIYLAMKSDKGEKYDLAEMDLKSFTRSSVRTKVMLTLLNGSKTAAELEVLINTRSTTILHSIKSLMDADLVEKKLQEYKLTNIGKIQAIIIDDLIDTIVTINQQHNFWLHHDVSAIPEELQKKIGMLSGSEVFKDDVMTILSTQEYFISELRMAKHIYGVSPIIVPGYAEAIVFAVEKGSQVDLIVTNKVLNRIIKENNDVLQWLLNSNRFRLYSIEDGITVAFTVTDRILSLGLFQQDGRYDVSSDLNCKGEKALLWGRELFDYYLSRSKPVYSI